ncbi:hypothetical protein DFH06DRAFT_1352146 [Mycena polygramma]|nr:hypothetical protein DFH06DRAFT_1352146 [Mycena polygramma]
MSLSKYAKTEREIRISMIKHLPAGSADWTIILECMSNEALFALSLRTRIHYIAVMEFIRVAGPGNTSLDEFLGGEKGDLISCLPRDVLLEVMGYLNLEDRLSLGRLTRKLKALGSHELQTGVAELIRGYGLRYHEIRFMQTVTRTIISGSSIPHLAVYPRYSDAAFIPGDIDFYSPS